MDALSNSETNLRTYEQNFTSLNQEECMDALSNSEKILTRHYKRVVTGGKGGRPVVILFPTNIQGYVEKIIEIRNSTDLVPSSNPYLFGYPDSTRWARGDVAIRKFAKKAHLQYPEQLTSNKLRKQIAIRKFAKKAHLQYPEQLTSNKLRKQIATVMQILNLNKEESEQFAQFMGHTEKTHNEFYKLPQDLYQTAKISKLLILMDKGLSSKYKGKSLEEIDINPHEEYAETDESDDAAESSTADASVAVDTNGCGVSAKKKTGRTPWTTAQINVVKTHFKKHIRLKQAPKKHECEKLLSQYPDLLQNKDWVRVKTCV
ncbi:hypothetical protein QE152_g26657 [Popillia japonica]|uniref:Uncharacterized protein n=1 Tax=Popillia japonica TaxID=7064 RepID=A0AAW1JXM6_POPJA